MNLVLEHTARVPYFTDMRQTLADAGINATDFDWYVSDLETNFSVPELGSGDCWLKGAELAGALQRNGLQFIWAVFSAFVPGHGNYAVKTPPVADRNQRYWRPPEVVPELPEAQFEIVCWDSGATLLIGLAENQGKKYLAANPEARSLSGTWPRSAA